MPYTVMYLCRQISDFVQTCGTISSDCKGIDYFQKEIYKPSNLQYRLNESNVSTVQEIRQGLVAEYLLLINPLKSVKHSLNFLYCKFILNVQSHREKTCSLVTV